MNKSRSALLSILFLAVSSAVLAEGHEHGEGGGRGLDNGGYHHNNGYNNNAYHNYGYHNHGYQDNVWIGGAVNDGSWDDNVWVGDGLEDDQPTNVVVGVPDGGYYDPSCQTVQQCNSLGQCTIQQSCESQ